MKRKITYQIGVDVLGNPLFITHNIVQDNPKQTTREPRKRFLTVLSTPIFKQY